MRKKKKGDWEKLAVPLLWFLFESSLGSLKGSHGHVCGSGVTDRPL